MTAETRIRLLALLRIAVVLDVPRHSSTMRKDDHRVAGSRRTNNKYIGNKKQKYGLPVWEFFQRTKSILQR